MPIIIPNNLPASETLQKENIFVMNKRRAMRQDIRPLRIAILNLMPNKITTETQLLRLLANTPLQVEVMLLHTKSHTSKNTSKNHLSAFYKNWDEVSDQKFDGLIITGAPVEQLAFEEVDYWNELTQILEWSKSHVFSTLHICWGAQAGLFYHYGINKYPLSEKMFGLFAHTGRKNTLLLKGFDDVFYLPHSRHTEIKKSDIEKVPELKILAESKESGIAIVANKAKRQIFVTGHVEYDRHTLRDEYERDLAKGLDIQIPKNYFKNDNPKKLVQINWRAHGNLLFSNWLNFYVYQEAPYDLEKLDI